MFRKKTSERCEYCRKFLSKNQISTGICPDCAEKVISGIWQSIKIRTVIGILFVTAVFILIHYMRINSFEYGTAPLNVMRVPVFWGYLTYNVRTFNWIVNSSPVEQIHLALLCFLIPFAKRVRFGVGAFYTFSTKHMEKTHASDHPYFISATTARGGADRAGLLICELFLSAVSGPFFFIHRIYMINRLSAYV